MGYKSLSASSLSLSLSLSLSNTQQVLEKEGEERKRVRRNLGCPHCFHWNVWQSRNLTVWFGTENTRRFEPTTLLASSTQSKVVVATFIAISHFFHYWHFLKTIGICFNNYTSYGHFKTKIKKFCQHVTKSLIFLTFYLPMFRSTLNWVLFVQPWRRIFLGKHHHGFESRQAMKKAFNVVAFFIICM
jgi:hypothetical protein